MPRAPAGTGGADTVVIITDLRFSGPEGEEVEEAARQIGVEALLPKPVPIWDLARLVLDGHSA